MGKPQSGFRLGNFAWLGSYSECMNLTEAQYCLAGVKITIPPGNQVSVLWLISMLITYRSAFDLFNPQFHVKSKCGTNPVHHPEPTCSPQIGWYTYLWRNISGMHQFSCCLCHCWPFSKPESLVYSAIYQIILNFSGGPQCALFCSGLVELGYVYN